MKNFKWVKGNTLPLAIPLKEVIYTEGHQPEKVDYFPPKGSIVSARLVSQYKKIDYVPTIEGNVVYITDDGSLPLGTYGIEVTVKETVNLRSFKCGQVTIVNSSDEMKLGEFPLVNGAVQLDAETFFWAKGDKGDDGLSAYEVAVEQGYSGTEQEWLASLIGPQGPQGIQGEKGDKGDTGPAGTTDYNDLENKPFIPSALSDLSEDSSHRVVTDAEKNAWGDKYNKPQAGIPKTDLSSGVQTSLDKADSAIQDISMKQDNLVSGENIKTVGGESVLGSGNIDVQAMVTPNESFPDTWNKSGTLEELVDDIREDDSAVEGKAYLAVVSCSDLPEGMVQAEMKVEVLSSERTRTRGVSSVRKVILLTITSEDVSPYYWQCTCAYNRIGTWKTFVPSDEAVQTPDWNQGNSSARDYIKHKPTSLSQFTDDLGNNPTHTHTTKADKVANATNGDFAGLDSNGNLTDSGKKASDFADAQHTHTKSDITDMPTALSEFSEDTTHRLVTDSEKSAWNAKYDKPNGGVPKSDLSSGVQASLDKADSAIQDLTFITDLIPEQATSENQLADKAFVNSSIQTNTADFKGTYNLVNDLSLTTSATTQQIATALGETISGVDNNDYAFVQIPTADDTPTEIARVDRYKFNGTSWAYEWSLNNSTFTASQWAAINSGITSGMITAITEAIAAKYTKPAGGIPDTDLTSEVQASLGKADSSIQGVKVNGSELTPDANKKVDVSVPTQLSQLSDDATHRLTSDTEKSGWSAKYDKPANGIPSTDLDSSVNSSLGKADTAYQKPSGGIPSTDMTEAVQTSLGKADTALQEHQDISGKVDKVEGKGLSTEDYTTEEKTKLGGIASSAQVNVLEGIKLGGVTQTITSKVVDLPAYPTTLPASDVSAWAKEPNKPSYSYSEVNNRPTALSDFTDDLGTNPTHTHSQYLTSHQDISGKADKVDNAISGNFAGLDSNGNIVDSGHKHSDYLTQHQDISGKADKVDSATSGNFAGLDEYGNLVDSGHKHSDYLTEHQDISGKADKSTTVTNVAYSSKKITKTINGTTSDIVSISDIKTDLELTKGDVGLGNVDNKSSETIRGEITSKNVTDALGYTPYDATNPNGYTSNIGTVTKVKVGDTGYDPASGVVSLPAYPTTLPASDVSAWAKESTKPTYNFSEIEGMVSASQLPSYVDDVIEGYYKTADGKFYLHKSGTTYSDEVTPESGKIYIDLDTNITYRWGGSTYVPIASDLALGETSSTAYRGDRGKTAYDHSQSAHARTDATKVEASSTNGNIKIDGTETTVYTHPGSGTNPHGTTKSDVGLGNVGNFKAVSTETNQGLSSTEQANARANIGAGTSSFSGNYNDLTNKPTIPTVPTNVSAFTNDAGYTTNVGTVTGVNVGSTSYSPTDGVVSLPAYPTTLPASDVSAWAKASSKPSYTLDEVSDGTTRKIPTKVSQLTNDSGYTTNTGTVTGVTVGTTAYTPTSGVVTIPAYPTTLPASDVYSWAKASSKPSYTYSEVGAASAGHDHTIGLATDTGTSTITLASAGKYKLTAGGQSVIFTMPTIPSVSYPVTSVCGKTGAVTLSASDVGAATSGHTHTLTIASDTGTSALNLAANTKYKLTAGGSTFIFKTPADTTYSAATQSANGLMSSADKTKLDGIATGATNVIESTVSGWGFTKNTGTVTSVKVGDTSYSPSSGVVSLPAYPTTLPASDVYSWAKASSKPSYTYSEVGAASSGHTHTTTIATSTATNQITLGFGSKYAITAGGTSYVFTMPSNPDTWRPLGTGATDACAGNDSRLSNARPASDVYSWAKAASKPSYSYSEISNTPSSLPASDVYAWAKAASKPSYSFSEITGTVSSSQLPSYVDDVLEYESKSKFPATGESGKIYVALDTNLTWRWGGSAYVEISPSLALGTTSSTAYRGDLGNIAYTHSQVTSGNPHGVTKSDVGLGNVGNFKAVSTVASQGLSSTEQANARANIGAGTSSFSGSYNDLSNKPTIPTVNNSTITIKQTGISDQTFTLNGSATTITLADTNTWRPIGSGASDAAAGNHTHTTSIATSSGTNKLTLAFGTKYSLNAGGTSYIFTMPANPNTDHYDWSDITNKPSTYAPTIGTTATTAAAGNHTHSTSIATSTGTNQLTLAFGTKYSISAGGTSYVFTMPANPNTDHYDWSDITNKPSSYTPSSHTHTKSQITDFPTLGTAAAKNVPSSGNASSTQVVMGNDSRLSDARTASDVYSWAKASTKPSYTLDEVSDGSTRKIPTKVSQLTNDSGYITGYTNTARLQVSDTSNKRINTKESTGNYIQFTAGTNKFTVSDGTNSFDVGVTPSVTVSVTDNNPTLAWSTKSKVATIAGTDINVTMPANPNTHNSHALTVTNGTASAVSQGTEITYVESVSGCNATSGNLTASTTRKKITIPTAVSETTVSGWGFTKNAGTVTSVKVGNTSYSPSSGVVSLPAYPTTLPASDVYSWAKASSKPSYTYSEVGAASSGHTHTTTIATSTATNQITLGFGSKYAITTGGTSYVFTMPSVDIEVTLSSNDISIVNNACTIYGADAVTFIGHVAPSSSGTPRFHLYNGDTLIQEVNNVATYNGVSLNCNTGVLTTTAPQSAFNVKVSAYMGAVESDKVTVTVQKAITIGGFSVLGTKSYTASGDNTLVIAPTNSNYTIPISSITLALSYGGSSASSDSCLRVTLDSLSNLQLKAAVLDIPSSTREYSLLITIADIKGNVFNDIETLTVQSIPVTSFELSGDAEVTDAGSYAYTISSILPSRYNRGIASLAASVSTPTTGSVSASVNGTTGATLVVTTMPDAKENVTLTVVATLVGGGTVTETKTVTLGVDYVDLGLPSGLKWATKNLGANSPEDDGDYYSWGNTDGWANGSGYNFDQTTYNSTSGASISADLTSSNDAAKVELGSPWRMPTKDEFQELYDNTDSQWVADYEGTGVAGRKFMKKTDHSVYVFFPASGVFNGTSRSSWGSRGYYWSASFYSSSNADYLRFSSSNVTPQYYGNRREGCTIRAVQ